MQFPDLVCLFDPIKNACGVSLLNWGSILFHAVGACSMQTQLRLSHLEYRKLAFSDCVGKAGVGLSIVEIVKGALRPGLTLIRRMRLLLIRGESCSFRRVDCLLLDYEFLGRVLNRLEDRVGL